MLIERMKQAKIKGQAADIGVGLSSVHWHAERCRVDTLTRRYSITRNKKTEEEHFGRKIMKCGVMKT